jgi:predicted nucleotidyltransferase
MMPNMGREAHKAGKAGKAGRARRRTSEARVGIADALFSSTQQRVLGLIYGQPDRSFTVSELIGLARAGSGAVQRELAGLAQSGLVTIETSAGRKHVRANASSPIFEELRGLVDKTIGVAQALAAALQPVADRVRLALLYGSVAKGTDAASSDIDVLIVSDRLSLEAAFAIFEPVEARLGRKVSPTIYTSEEFLQRWRERQPFLTRVLEGKHHVLMGSVDAAGSSG